MLIIQYDSTGLTSKRNDPDASSWPYGILYYIFHLRFAMNLCKFYSFYNIHEFSELISKKKRLLCSKRCALVCHFLVTLWVFDFSLSFGFDGLVFLIAKSQLTGWLTVLVVWAMWSVKRSATKKKHVVAFIRGDPRPSISPSYLSRSLFLCLSIREPHYALLYSLRNTIHWEGRSPRESYTNESVHVLLRTWLQISAAHNSRLVRKSRSYEKLIEKLLRHFFIY